MHELPAQAEGALQEQIEVPTAVAVELPHAQVEELLWPQMNGRN